MPDSGTPLVTIGLPMLNVGGTVVATLRSIFAQTCDKWELLVVDDGSTDNSLDIVRRIRDPRVKILADGFHRGLVYRLNQIAEIAQTTYVARMDADDLMHPERIARQLAFLDRHPGVAVVGTWAYVIDDADRVIGARETPVGSLDPRKVLRRNPFVHPTVMARRDWFLANPYDPGFPRAEDRELWCRTSGRDEFATLAERLLFYRDYTGPMSGKYAESCRTERRIFRRYGPPIVGRLGTWSLIASSRAKQTIYVAAAGARVSSLLARARNSAIPAQSIVQSEELLATLGNVAVPGLP